MAIGDMWHGLHRSSLSEISTKPPLTDAKYRRVRQNLQFSTSYISRDNIRYVHNYYGKLTESHTWSIARQATISKL